MTTLFTSLKDEHPRAFHILYMRLPPTLLPTPTRSQDSVLFCSQDIVYVKH